LGPRRCVVDARYLLQHLEDGQHTDGTVNEAVNQIAFADLILLNKVDLVTDTAQKKQVIKAIRQVNNSARIVECQLNKPEDRPPMDQLLFNNLFSVDRVLEVSAVPRGQPLARTA
jgi:G3E family GTPase